MSFKNKEKEATQKENKKSNGGVLQKEKRRIKIQDL